MGRRRPNPRARHVQARSDPPLRAFPGHLHCWRPKCRHAGRRTVEASQGPHPLRFQAVVFLFAFDWDLAMRITRIHIKGFKSIVDQKIDLGRVNCLIGANGVGKSNIIEAIGILSAAAKGTVDDEAIIRRGVRPGLPRLYKSSFSGSTIPPHVFLEAEADNTASYRVTLLNPLIKPEPAWSFKSEQLAAVGISPPISRRPQDKNKQNLDDKSGLVAAELLKLDPSSPGAVLVKILQGYAIYSPNTPALRAISPDPQMRNPIGLVGGGLAEAFSALKQLIGDDQLDSILDLIDWVCDIDSTKTASSLLSPSVPRTKDVLRFTDRFMALSRNTLTAYDASEGALYILFAAILCLSPSSPSLFAIDNLDAALNPRLVTRLASRLRTWLIAANPDRQLLFTAHNPAILDGLDLDRDDIRLFAVERNSNGHSVIRRIKPSPELRELRETYPLSRLWAMGNLGAVPNV